MHFEETGSACEATCANIDAPATCSDSPLESCQCDTDYVKSGSICVHISECGCTVNNKYYKVTILLFVHGMQYYCLFSVFSTMFVLKYISQF